MDVNVKAMILGEILSQASGREMEEELNSVY
jgi:hypothetical protein